MVLIPKPCRKEIEAFPEQVRGDLADALARLDAGLVLCSGVYRVVYALGARGVVHVLHAFKKTTQAISARNLELARTRLKEVRS